VFPNLQAPPGAEVEGALWHVRTTDLSILGRQEGGGDAYGSRYVRVDGPEGPVETRTYISERRVTGFRPSRR
jgi:hypothetical protein